MITSDRPIARRSVSRRAALTAAVCVTGLLTGGAPAAVALELERPHAKGYCLTNNSGVKNRYVVKAGATVENGTEVESYRLQVTVRLKERFGRTWRTLKPRTVLSRVQSTLDDPEWPVYRRRYTSRQGKRLQEVKGTATLTLRNASGAVVDTAGPVRFRSIYDPRRGMTPCLISSPQVSSSG